MKLSVFVLALCCTVGCAGTHPVTTSAPSRGGRSVPAVAKALINASVEVTFNAALTAFSDVPLETLMVDPDKGIVESPYFDLSRFEWRAERYPLEERTVRLRVVVQPDTLGRGARVAVYALYQPGQRLGMTVARTNERAVPSDHPAAAFATKLLGKIEEKATGGGTRTP